MFRFAATLATVFLASLTYTTEQAHAEDCPDYYRFVDFGLKDNQGILYRGGLLLRAEGFSAQALLLEDKTQCLKVRDLAKDGHGNPIPVVASVHYLPEVTGIALNTLQVSTVAETSRAANETASDHLARMQQADTTKTRGENFVCASATRPASLSCQLASPYAGNPAPVVYCDATTCRMPVMAINAELMVTASWPSSETLLKNPQAAGADFFLKAQAIHDFLKPLSASL